MIGSQPSRSTRRIPDRGHPLRRRGFWIGVAAAAVAAFIAGGPHGVMAVGALVIVFAVVSWPVGLIDQHYEETTVDDWLDYGAPQDRIVYHQTAPGPDPVVHHVHHIDWPEAPEWEELTPAARRLLEETRR